MTNKTPQQVENTPAEKVTGEPLPTFTDVLTLTRWIKAGKFVKPITIGNAHYFRNSELIDYLDNKTA